MSRVFFCTITLWSEGIPYETGSATDLRETGWMGGVIGRFSLGIG